MERAAVDEIVGGTSGRMGSLRSGSLHSVPCIRPDEPLPQYVIWRRASLRVMARVNLTLDPDTIQWLERHAKPERRAALARTLIREGIARREAIARRKKLAADYVAGHADDRALLRELEVGAFEVLGDEEG